MGRYHGGRGRALSLWTARVAAILSLAAVAWTPGSVSGQQLRIDRLRPATHSLDWNETDGSHTVSVVGAMLDDHYFDPALTRVFVGATGGDECELGWDPGRIRVLFQRHGHSYGPEMVLDADRNEAHRDSCGTVETWTSSDMRLRLPGALFAEPGELEIRVVRYPDHRTLEGAPMIRPRGTPQTVRATLPVLAPPSIEPAEPRVVQVGDEDELVISFRGSDPEWVQLEGRPGCSSRLDAVVADGQATVQLHRCAVREAGVIRVALRNAAGVDAAEVLVCPSSRWARAPEGCPRAFFIVRRTTGTEDDATLGSAMTPVISAPTPAPVPATRPLLPPGRRRARGLARALTGARAQEASAMSGRLASEPAREPLGWATFVANVARADRRVDPTDLVAHVTTEARVASAEIAAWHARGAAVQAGRRDRVEEELRAAKIALARGVSSRRPFFPGRAAQALEDPPGPPVAARARLRGYVAALELEAERVRREADLADSLHEQAVRREERLRDSLDEVARSMHDTAKAIISNMRA